MRKERNKGNEHHQQPSNKSKIPFIQQACEESTNKLHSHNYPLFQHYISEMNTRSLPMHIHTHHIISMQNEIFLIVVLGDSSQFNRAMSESGVHDKRSIQLGGK